MVFLLQKFNQICSKLENHHHHNHHPSQPALSASMEAFQTHVSNSLKKLLPLSSSKSAGSEIPSFPWIQQCYELVPIIQSAFAKLVVEVDFPMSRWEAASVDRYLKYSLSLLELCNSVSSSLSNLGKARVSLAHGLSLVENSSPSSALEHLKAIQFQPKGLSKGIRFQESEEVGKGSCLTSKETVIHQALDIMQGMVFWVGGILMSGLAGNPKPYLEVRNSSRRIVDPLLSGLNSRPDEVMERNGGLKEVKELNDAVAGLAAAIRTGKNSGAEAEELRRRLEVFEKFVDGLGKEVDSVFDKALAGRNQLLNGLQQQKK
ncbi:protein BPS1, chloroplastic-like [Pyrus communis]|uniref:protein BPS1, chloroplastic-like n=1 Tax=Pyrus communis TaxID=23211 RepID=UPI0035C1B798